MDSRHLETSCVLAVGAKVFKTQAGLLPISLRTIPYDNPEVVRQPLVDQALLD